METRPKFGIALLMLFSIAIVPTAMAWGHSQPVYYYNVTLQSVQNNGPNNNLGQIDVDGAYNSLPNVTQVTQVGGLPPIYANIQFLPAPNYYFVSWAVIGSDIILQSSATDNINSIAISGDGSTLVAHYIFVNSTPDNDLDNDGFISFVFGGNDCNDYDNTINPGAAEVCDSKDNDCDDQIDDGVCKRTNLLFWQQKFRGCGLDASNMTLINSTFMQNNPYIKGITNESGCRNLGSWYCDLDGFWKNSTGQYGSSNPPVSNASTLPNNSTPAACCPSGWCANATGSCARNAFNNTNINNLFEHPPTSNNTYKCVNGIWKPARVHWDWLRQVNGTCDDLNDCFASNAAADTEGLGRDDGKDFCIPENATLKDHYCRQGNWSTRTKMIALQLLQYVNDNNIVDFVLFCDDANKALNYPDYNISAGGTSKIILDYIASTSQLTNLPRANNFCVLRYDPSTINPTEDSFDDEVIAGVSLNQPINVTPSEDDHPFLEAIGKPTNYCSQVPSTSNSFVSCDTSEDDVWYNPRANSVIFSTKAGGFTLVQTGFNLLTALRNFFIGIIQFILGQGGAPGAIGDVSFVNFIADFNRLYIAEHNLTSEVIIRGVIETKTIVGGTPQQAMLINYTGFDFDVCEVPSIQRFVCGGTPTTICPPGGGSVKLNCTQQGDSYLVISSDADVLDLWPDFTSKLRPK